MNRAVSSLFLGLLLMGIFVSWSTIQPSVRAQGETFVSIVNAVDGTYDFYFTDAAPLGTVFTANMTVTDVRFLTAWQLNITYDPTLLNITGNDQCVIPSDNVFGQYADALLPDRHYGMIFWTAMILDGNGPGHVNVTETGTLCQINFTIIKNDESVWTPLHLVVVGEYPIYTDLINPDAESILFTPRDGHYYLRVGHDVGVTGITCFKTVVGVGTATNVSVTLENQGTYDETFNLTVWANETVIFEYTNISLSNSSFSTIIFKWNTTGFAYAYNIRANVSSVENETDLSDNTLIFGIVKVSCIGDINGDYVTDAKDFVLVKKASPSMPSSPNWNSNANMNDDGVIDVKDYQIVKNHTPSVFP